MGADGVLVVAPYYNKPSQEGLYQHYKAINDAIGIPIIVYNIPPRSVVDISIDTMKRLFELKNIAGVKDATANVARIALQRRALGADFIQLSGEDMTALAVLAHGGDGCISVTSNVAPRLCADFQDAGLKGDFKAALAIQDRLTPLHAALFVDPNQQGRNTLCRCSVRLPTNCACRCCPPRRPLRLLSVSRWSTPGFYRNNRQVRWLKRKRRASRSSRTIAAPASTMKSARRSRPDWS